MSPLRGVLPLTLGFITSQLGCDPGWQYASSNKETDRFGGEEYQVAQSGQLLVWAGADMFAGMLNAEWTIDNGSTKVVRVRLPPSATDGAGIKLAMISLQRTGSCSVGDATSAIVSGGAQCQVHVQYHANPGVFPFFSSDLKTLVLEMGLSEEGRESVATIQLLRRWH